MHERFSKTQFRNLLNWLLLLGETSALYYLYFQIYKGERETDVNQNKQWNKKEKVKHR